MKNSAKEKTYVPLLMNIFQESISKVSVGFLMGS